MKNSELNLLILDDNTLIADPLSKYLNNRFGSRINVSTFVDVDECMQNIDLNSHVIVLNYDSNDSNNLNKRSNHQWELFKALKRQNPKNEVILLTSKQGIQDAIKEMQKRTSDYIRKKERYLYDILSLFDKVVFSPVNTYVTAPTKKLTREYKIIGYVLIVFAAFAASVISVLALSRAIKLLRL